MTMPIIARNNLTLSVESLESLKFRTPYFLFDLKKVEENYANLKKHLKNFTIFYAVKANSEPEIIRRLAKNGCNFEIASVGELKLLQKNNVNAADILYSNPIKPWQMIRSAYKQGVYRFAFDSVVELQKLAKYAPGASVYLRFMVNDQGSRFPLSKKFGAEPQDIVPLLTLARDLGLTPYGLTFHVGSQSLNPKTWELAIKMAGEAMRELKEKDIALSMLDIGGGFPASYGEDEPSLSHIGQVITAAVARFLPYKVRLFAEPGRSMVADTGVLVTSVTCRAERGGRNWLYLDVGAFNGMMETLETNNQFRYPVKVIGRSAASNLFTLTGPTCDTQDTLFYDLRLPRDVMLDDRIAIFSAGAYTTTYASHFNGFGPPKVYFLN